MADHTRLSGSTANPSSAVVSADQQTILGNGTAEDPLRAGLVDDTIRASFRGGSFEPLPGMPVFISFVPEPGGVTTVQPTTVSAVSPLQQGFSAFASVYGVIASVNLDGTVQVAARGSVTLTELEWEFSAGEVGGLTPGATYFAALGGLTAFVLSQQPDQRPGYFATRVGVALNATTMLLAPSVPVQNLGDQVVFAEFAGQSLSLGSVVHVTVDRHVDAATSNMSAASAQVLGVIAALDPGGQPIVQVGGSVFLESFQWDALTDTTPSMKAGTAYFVDTDARPGRLTATPPSTGFRVQVGVGFSSEILVLSTPAPVHPP